MTGVYVMGMHLIGMHLIGVHLTGVYVNAAFVVAGVSFLILALSGNLTQTVPIALRS